MGNHHTSCMVATAPRRTVPLRRIFSEWSMGDGLWQSHMQTTGFCRLWWPYLFHVGTGWRSFCTSLHHCFFKSTSSYFLSTGRGRQAKFQISNFKLIWKISNHFDSGIQFQCQRPVLNRSLPAVFIQARFCLKDRYSVLKLVMTCTSMSGDTHLFLRS